MVYASVSGAGVQRRSGPCDGSSFDAPDYCSLATVVAICFLEPRESSVPVMPLMILFLVNAVLFVNFRPFRPSSANSPASPDGPHQVHAEAEAELEADAVAKADTYSALSADDVCSCANSVF